MSDSPISDDLAREAFIYGYSMDAAYTFLYETTITPAQPLNTFQQLRELADDTYTAHPTINNDTLHLMGWFDVAAEPVVVTVPDHHPGRYWILHTMDMGHYTTAMIGSRTRGTTGGRFLFASRTWDGQVPDDIDDIVRSDSDLIKVMARIMTTGGPDLPAAQALMDRWQLETLSAHAGTPAPDPVTRDYPDPAITSWVERVNTVLAEGTMASADQNWLPRYAALGLSPGRPDPSDTQREAATRGQRLGMDHLAQLAPSLTTGARSLGTRADLQDGPRDLFALGTYVGQWSLPPAESVYVKIETGSDGQPLNGSGGKRYRAQFTAPDVSEFWSVTAYRDDNRLMARNALNRHSRGDRTLTPGNDGLYTIELSSDAETNADNPNYLPIPEADTYLILRLYGPSPAIQAGDYTPPTFTVVDD